MNHRQTRQLDDSSSTMSTHATVTAISAAPRRFAPLVALLALVLALMPILASAQDGGGRPSAPVVIEPGVRGPSIVLTDAGTDPAVVAADNGIETGFVYRSAANGFSANLTDADVATLREDTNVESISIDRLVTTDAVPNQLARVGADTSATSGAGTGASHPGVGIAIVDSGVGPNNDLNVVGGVDCTGSGGVTTDTNGHGTHVAGIAAARDNGDATTGIAPGAAIYSVKVLIGSSGPVSNIICGLNWIAAHPGGINVVNMSLGFAQGPGAACGSGSAYPLREAICGVRNRGIPVVVAAGNQNGASANTYSPASYPEVISVSAYTDTDGRTGGGGSSCNGADDRIATYSNVNADVMAPGSCITSTAPGGGTAVKSGTSMASPLVAGAVALYGGLGGITVPRTDPRGGVVSGDPTVLYIGDGTVPGGGGTATPPATATPRATATSRPATATPRVSTPTATPRPATATPRPATATPRPATATATPRATATGVTGRPTRPPRTGATATATATRAATATPRASTPTATSLPATATPRASTPTATPLPATATPRASTPTATSLPATATPRPATATARPATVTATPKATATGATGRPTRPPRRTATPTRVAVSAQDVEPTTPAARTRATPTVLPPSDTPVPPTATSVPSEEPTLAPTETPTEVATEEPTLAPTETPTEEPTLAPTETPTEEPTLVPTDIPTEVPTEVVTEEPTVIPTLSPTIAPASVEDTFSTGTARYAVDSDPLTTWYMDVPAPIISEPATEAPVDETGDVLVDGGEGTGDVPTEAPAEIVVEPTTTPEDLALEIDLGYLQTVGSVRVQWTETTYAHDAELQTSLDGETWTTVAYPDIYDAIPGEWEEIQLGIDTQYIRFLFPNAEQLTLVGGLSEVEVLPPPAI